MWVADGSSAVGEQRPVNLRDLSTTTAFSLLFLPLHPPRSYNLRSQGLTVYSLCPDRKDIRLSDQRAGAGARRINEAPGWREGGREKGRGRLGQVG